GFGCIFAHAGSAFIAIGFRVGTVPLNVTVPVTVDWAYAGAAGAPMRASPAASQNPLAQRVLVRLVIANLASWINDDGSTTTRLPRGPRNGWRDSTPDLPVRAR